MDIKIAQQETITELVFENQKLKQERDEAKIDAAQLADRLSGHELRTTEELAKMEQELHEWIKCAEKLAAIIGAPDEMESLLWKTDDEINEAWSAFKKLKGEQNERKVGSFNKTF